MFYRNSNFYSTSKGNILTANIPRPSTIYQTILAQIRRQRNFWKYFRLCDAGFSDFPYDMQISPSGSLKPEWTWPNTSLFQIFLTTLSPLPFFNNEDGFVGQSCFQTAIEENWSEGRIEKNYDLLFSQQSRHSRPSSLCEASSSCFFSATPFAIKTGQNCTKIVGTYVFMDRENLSKQLWEY